MYGNTPRPHYRFTDNKTQPRQNHTGPPHRQETTKKEGRDHGAQSPNKITQHILCSTVSRRILVRAVAFTDPWHPDAATADSCNCTTGRTSTALD